MKKTLKEYTELSTLEKEKETLVEPIVKPDIKRKVNPSVNPFSPGKFSPSVNPKPKALIVTEEEENIVEINYDKLLRVLNDKKIAKITINLSDPYGNKSIYDIYFKFEETTSGSKISLNEMLYGKEHRMQNAESLSNLQNKPKSFKEMYGEYINLKETQTKELLKMYNQKDEEGMLRFFEKEYFDENNIFVTVKQWMRSGVRSVLDGDFQIINH